MNIRKLPSELAGMARHALEDVEETLEQGRDAVIETKDEGLSSMSSMIDRGARGMHTLRSAVVAYASLTALATALKNVSPGRRILGAFGLQRRPSTLVSVATNLGVFAAGAAVGAGVAMVLTPQSGAEARQKISKFFKSVRSDAEGVARDVTDAARNAASEVSDAARNATSEGARGASTQGNATNAGNRSRPEPTHRTPR